MNLFPVYPINCGNVFFNYISKPKLLTIMKNKIGAHAGELWHLLYNRGQLNLRDIGEATHYGQDVIFLALGWLLREDKIRIVRINGLLYYELNYYQTLQHG